MDELIVRLVAVLWLAAILGQAGRWFGQCWSDTGSGGSLCPAGCCLTFAAPFLWSAAVSGGPTVVWIIPGIVSCLGVVFLIEAIHYRWQDRSAVTAPIAIRAQQERR